MYIYEIYNLTKGDILSISSYYSPPNQSVPICLHSNSIGQHLTNYKAETLKWPTPRPAPTSKNLASSKVCITALSKAALLHKSLHLPGHTMMGALQDNRRTLYNTIVAHLAQ